MNLRISFPSLCLLLVSGLLTACGDPPEETCASTVAVGYELPVHTIQDCDGTAVDLSTIVSEHQVTYITFGAGWCTACKEEIPALNDLEAQFADKSVAIIQILVESSISGEAPPLGLCGQWAELPPAAQFDVLIDVDQETLCDHFGEAVGTLPVHLLVTQDGTVQFRLVGALPEDMADRINEWL